MGSIKQINIKNRTYYFYNDIIDIETFDSSNLKLDKKPYKNLDIYNIWYVAIKKIAHGYDSIDVYPEWSVFHVLVDSQFVRLIIERMKKL